MIKVSSEDIIEAEKRIKENKQFEGTTYFDLAFLFFIILVGVLCLGYYDTKKRKEELKKKQDFLKRKKNKIHLNLKKDELDEIWQKVVARTQRSQQTIQEVSQNQNQKITTTY